MPHVMMRMLMRMSAKSLRLIVCLIAFGALAWISISPAFTGQSTSSQHLKSAAPPPAAPSKSQQAYRLNSLGVAALNQQQMEKALKYFEQAAALDPHLFVARLNQGIALLNLQRYEAAGKILLEATRTDPKSARAWFNLGLLQKSTNETQKAIDSFEHVAAIDPADPETHYFLGLLYSQLHQYDKAIAAYQRALAINPFHVSSEFGLAQACQRSGKPDEAKTHLARFQHLTQDKLGSPISLVYGEQGKYSLAEQTAPALAPLFPRIPVHFDVATEQAGLPAHASASVPAPKTSSDFLGTGACVFDFDGDGKPDLFLANADGSGAAALYHNLGYGRFENVTRAAGLEIKGHAISCAAGDYDNDGHTDLAVSFNGGVQLFHNEGNGTFKDATDAVGIHMDGLVMGLTFVDYDHDGDIDLYATRFSDFPVDDIGNFAPPPGSDRTTNLLWRNNGNKTFTDWSKQSGLDHFPDSLGAIASDVNNDRAVDLILTGWQKSIPVLLNQREGEFKYSVPFASVSSAPALGAAALDFNKDGWVDYAFTYFGDQGLMLWRNKDGANFEPVALPKLDWLRGWGVAAIDYDNDGWIDLVAVGENAQGGQIVLLRNEGPKGFRDVAKEVGLDKVKLANPRAVIAADFDGDGATDLLITQNGGAPVLLRNVGGNRNNWIQLALKGTNDNKNGFGAKVELYAGALYQKWEVVSASGYLGQSSAQITAGLGAAREADVVRMLWPTGVLQDEVQLAAGKIHNISEIDRRGSSCPIVFVWNGSRYEFLADMVGPGIVGHWIAPGQRDVPDPTEYLKVDSASVRPRNGRLSFRMLEPMEELDYLDQVRLLAVDHPSNIEVYPNEYFASNPPFPEFKLISSLGAHLPAGAWDDQGRDVMPLLAYRDRVYVTDFSSAPYQGFAAMHTLTLDLGDWDSSHPLQLLLDGFTDYFTANSMYAAWQAGVQPVAPYVEALDSSGKWVRVMDDMGFPAGLARTMIADLTGRLPAGTRRIRIVTNLKTYWDRIRISNSAPDLPYHLHEVPLAGATLDFRGYPRVLEGNPLNDIRYVYEDISPTGPYTRQVGNYTRYGDVSALVQASDNNYAIYGSGDEVQLEFNPSNLPPLPSGWTRDYFFFADGFAKDMDFYAAHGDTVDPLPFHTLVPYPYPAGTNYPSDDQHLNYLLDFNTRPVAGPAGTAFRFQYPSSKPHP
jgi:tetratricopeptide (TPR) repeat protein